MPQYILEIPNCEETISNPIVISVLNRVIRTYKWYRGFDFKFLNLGEAILVKGSEIDVLSQDRSQQRLTTDTTVEVEVSERYNEEMVRAGCLFRSGNHHYQCRYSDLSCLTSRVLGPCDQQGGVPWQPEVACTLLGRHGSIP